MTAFFQGVLAFLLILSLSGCNSDSGSNGGTGTLRLLATDAPFNYENVLQAKITIDEISLRGSSGSKVTVLTREITLDLLQLRNGLVETLADLEIPSGGYNEILLNISSAKVELKDGRVFPLKVPSGAQSGLKVFVKPDITITTGLSTDVLLDFDLARSFIATGTTEEITGFNFKPVIRAQSLTLAGTVSGQVISVTEEIGIAGAIVTIKKGTEVITTAVTDEEGFFKVLGLPVETYDVKAEAEGFGSLTIEAVPITAGNEVTTHFILTPAL